jgi:FMN phosphatase YigB (HAD superfamily)
MSRGLAILDIGATLVTGPAQGPAARIAARAGLDATGKATLRYALMTRPFSSPEEVIAFAGALDGKSMEHLDDAIHDVWAAQQEESQPIVGAAKALLDLRESGFELAIISNIWRPYLSSVRRHYGPFFDEHVAPELQLFSFREGRAKPTLELFLRAVELAAVDPTMAVMIGDSFAEDIEPAAAVGIRTLWVLHRPQREVADLARVLNGEAHAPTRTVRSIAAVSGDLVASVLAHPTRPLHVD